MTGANVARAMRLSAPTGARDDRAPRARRADHARPGQGDRLHARRRGPGPGDRQPPPADRALPHRRPAHSLGRGPRGGRAPRARDVPGARGAHARRDRRRDDLPARPPDPRRVADPGRAARRRRRRAPASACCASRTRPRTCSTTSAPRAWSPGWRVSSRRPARSRSWSTRDGRRCAITRSVAETVSVDRRPLAAAAGRAARPARARRRSATAAEPAQPLAREPGERGREPRDALADLLAASRPSRPGGSRRRRRRARSHRR